MRAFALSDITSPLHQVTTIPFLLEGDAVEYYPSLTKQVHYGWFELMCVLGQRFDCISHQPVDLSRMLTLRESDFPRHAGYMEGFKFASSSRRSIPVTSRWLTSLTLNFLEGLSNDAVRRQYIVEV